VEGSLNSKYRAYDLRSGRTTFRITGSESRSIRKPSQDMTEWNSYYTFEIMAAVGVGLMLRLILSGHAKIPPQTIHNPFFCCHFLDHEASTSFDNPQPTFLCVFQYIKPTVKQFMAKISEISHYSTSVNLVCNAFPVWLTRTLNMMVVCSATSSAMTTLRWGRNILLALLLIN
jgi:hypothetical protein